MAAETQTAALPAGVTEVRSIEGITEYRLKNGLQILLFPDPSKPTVTVNLTIFVGSRHEGYGEAGMAHLLEHMLFKGTPTHPSVPKVLQERGADFNGTTWLDRTNYYETLPAEGDNLEFAIRLEADRMMNSSIKGEDLASEMTVVRNEFERGENSPPAILGQRMMSAAFEWHNYGKATIGNRADIERVPVESLRAFYRKYYQPDNAALIVAGKFEPEAALEAISAHFGKIPRPERVLSNTYTEEPAQDGERIVTLRRVGDVAVVGVQYHIPSGGHPDFPAIDVMENILSAAPSGRLYKALVESKKAAGVSGSTYALHDPGILRFMAQVTQGNEPQVVLDSMLDEIAKLADKGVTEEELERARTRLLSQREQAAAESKDLAIELSEWASQGDWRLYFLYRDRLEAVTAEDVHRVAHAFLQPANRTVGIYLPTKKTESVEIPQVADLAASIGEYTGREVIAMGESFDVTPKNIEARTQRTVLPSGIQAALLEKKTRGQVVNLRLSLDYGDAQNLQGRQKAMDLLPTMMVRGTQKLTRQQLQDALDKYQAKLSSGGTAGKLTFSLQVKREHLLPVLDLLAQVLREPTFPEHELELIKQAQVSGFEQRLTDPQALAQERARRLLNPYPADDPRYVATMQEEIARTKAIRREDIVNLYDEFVGTSHGRLTIVGDFSEKEALPSINRMLANWQAKQSYARLEKKNFPIKGDSIRIETPGKANAIYFAATVLPLRDDDDDYPAMVIGDFILGGGSLSSRLGDRVRQQEGLSYGVGTGLQALSLDRRAVFYTYAIANPGNMDKLTQVIKEELNRLIAEGITEGELAAAKQGHLQSEFVERGEDTKLASELEESLENGRTMLYHDDIEQKIRKLTVAEVNAALKKYLKPDGLVIVTAGDFAGKKPVATTPDKRSE